MRMRKLPVQVVLMLAFLAGTASVLRAAEPAVVKLWNYNIHDKKYQQKMYKLFNERHPEIRIDYSSISTTVYDQTLQAAFVANEPPDLFLPSGGIITFQYLLAKGWTKPLNDVAPSATELKDWMAQFPAVLDKFVDGSNVINGKVYGVDLNGDYSYYKGGFPLYTNLTLLGEAGLKKPPATQSELRQAAAKITAVGAGKYFGFSVALRNVEEWHHLMGNGLAWAAGVMGTGLHAGWGPDLRDGQFHHASPEYVKAMNVFIGMRKDGSVFPGESTMDDEQQKMLLATGKVGMQSGGWWNPGNYIAYNPDVQFAMSPTPTPDDGVWRGPVTRDPSRRTGALGGYMVSAFTKNPGAVWEVIKFISGPEYQTGWVQGGYGISYLPEADKRENFTVPQMYQMVQWYLELDRKNGPSLSDGARKAEELTVDPYPSFHEVMSNVYLGASGMDAFADLDKKYSAALDEGIRKAQEAGFKVTRSDFVFPDWDPYKDYVQKKK